jgi:hypothetical protein
LFLLLLGALAAWALAPAASASASSKTVWLCKPGKAKDPCAPSLKTTLLSNSAQSLGVKNVKRAKHPKLDCFYIYPTVSDQKTANASLHIDPEERSIALYQAARYSQECRVFAPMYKQVTLTQLLSGNPTTAHMSKVAYRSALSGWKAYLHKYNHGRPFVLIGHSQGSFVLRQLIAQQIDKNRKLRKRLVSAILLGGNVLVKKGSDVGGDFKHIPACRSESETGCVIAWSTFNAPVPSDSLFGRTTESGMKVLCAYPGASKLKTIEPTAPFAPGTTIGAATLAIGFPKPTATTPWVEYDHAYRGQCSSAGGANVLQITDQPGAAHLNAVPDATWGLHLVDANIALGNLVSIVRRETKAFLSSK